MGYELVLFLRLVLKFMKLPVSVTRYVGLSRR